MTTPGSTTNKLIEAIHAGRLSDVINALNQGVDIETPDMHGCRGLPLRTACFQGDLAIVRELLKRGADVNAAANDGPGAPIRLALRKGHWDVIALLQQHGAQLPESVPAAARTPPPVLDEADIPALPDSSPDSNVIEFTRTDFTRTETLLTAAETELPSQFGTETNVLSMDLLFHDENEAPLASARPKNTR